jgi:hypothetical protein
MTLQSPPLVSRAWLLELLRREMYDEAEHKGDQYVAGHNARARSLIAALSQGSVEAGLVELKQSDSTLSPREVALLFDLTEAD